MAQTRYPLDKWGNEYGYMGNPPEKELQYEVVLIEGKYVKIKEFVAHTFSMGDVEDPDLYAAQPLYEWQQSEVGAWVMAHAVEPPFWTRQPDMASFGYRYYVVARLKEADQTYFKLKWSSIK